ncbi:MAG: DNA adenine methylase [Candidatus Hermodarchaeota archaeon]
MVVYKFKGKINSIKHFLNIFQPNNLSRYNIENFNVNECSNNGLIDFNENTTLAFSKWKGPKRTRTYPFKYLFDLLGAKIKIVTIIPIIKDEGAGSQNNDRINAMTFSWMNLLNIYIILGWYENAKKRENSNSKIKDQKLNNNFIKKKLKEVIFYKDSAKKWNDEHFYNDFEYIWNQAIESYKKIAKKERVSLHKSEDHRKKLESFKVENKIDYEKFKVVTNRESKKGMWREIKTNHKRESLTQGKNARFKIQDYLGGIYYLTCDEVYEEDNLFIIQESKNNSKGKFPNSQDIKDGIFKLLLFLNIDKLELNEKVIYFEPRLKLTGDLKGELELPNDKKEIDFFINLNKLSRNSSDIIYNLNEISEQLKIKIHFAWGWQEKKLNFIIYRKKKLKVVSPLRYPGGKSRVLDRILPLIPKCSEFREPFVGGGSVFIGAKQLLPNDVVFKINDLNYDLYCFWRTVKNNLDEMVHEINQIKNKFISGPKLLEYLNKDEWRKNELKRGIRFFIINRVSFSGLSDSGGYSEESFNGRFTDTSIERLADLKFIMNNVIVTHGDYSNLLSDTDDDVFFFFDPPYLSSKNSKLYGKDGNLHISFIHEEFAEKIKNIKKANWLITLDASPKILDLFSFAKPFIYSWNLKYGMTNYKKGSLKIGEELFISNYDLSERIDLNYKMSLDDFL